MQRIGDWDWFVIIPLPKLSKRMKSLKNVKFEFTFPILKLRKAEECVLIQVYTTIVADQDVLPERKTFH